MNYFLVSCLLKLLKYQGIAVTCCCKALAGSLEDMTSDGRRAGPWHELRLRVPTGKGTGCSAGGWKQSTTGMLLPCVSLLSRNGKIKFPKQRENSGISRVKTNWTFFSSFRENCVCLREISRRWMSTGLRGRMGQIPKCHSESHLQSLAPSPRVSQRPCSVYLWWQKDLPAWWASAGVPASHSLVNVWPWLPSVSAHCLTPQRARTCYCGHLWGAGAVRNPLQVQHRWLLALLGWHSLGKPRGNYKTPFIWGVSRCFANIESLIPPSAPLKLAGIIGGAKGRVTVAAQRPWQRNAVTTLMTWLIYLANWV